VARSTDAPEHRPGGSTGAGQTSGSPR